MVEVDGLADVVVRAGMTCVAVVVVVVVVVGAGGTVVVVTAAATTGGFVLVRVRVPVGAGAVVVVVGVGSERIAAEGSRPGFARLPNANAMIVPANGRKLSTPTRLYVHVASVGRAQ